MEWNKELLNNEWAEISNYEAKLKIAKKLASFVHDGDDIGFGSGSTAMLAVKEIAARVKEEGLHIRAIPTSREITSLCNSLSIPVAPIYLAKPDWGFDGADEVSPENWLIKGRGGAMFNEKLVMCNAKKTYILVDGSKFVLKLCTNFGIPVECVQDSVVSVKSRLFELGASSVTLRLAGKSKDGPVITELGNFILDAKFDNVTADLETKIKSVVGVLDSGLFIGYNIEILSV